MKDERKIKEYYNHGIEKDRLELDHFKLEGIRSKQIISRYLKSERLRIIDIGGGAGYYAFWLQTLGHRVSLIDLSSKNVDLARAFESTRGVALESCRVGLATSLNFHDNEFDVALLLGPLYHLTEKQDRLTAIREAKRVLKPGGVLIAAFISRYASLMDGLKRNLINDDAFEKILLKDLQSGLHINDTDNLEYFTTAYFHTPQEMTDELLACGLTIEKLVAVESVAWMIDNLSEKIKDERYETKIMNLISGIESNTDLLAISPHILGIAKKNNS